MTKVNRRSWSEAISFLFPFVLISWTHQVSHVTGAHPENLTTSDRCSVRFSRRQMKNSSVEECARGRALSSSSGLRNFKWCLYLYSSGSAVHCWIWTWLRNASAVNPFIFHVVENSLSQRCDVLRSWMFCNVILEWNTVFGHREPVGPHLFFSKAHFSGTTMNIRYNYILFWWWEQLWEEKKTHTEQCIYCVGAVYSCFSLLIMKGIADFPI